MILTCLLGLGLWQPQLLVAKAAPVFNTLTVINTNDSGAGSLRQSILDAASGDTITFDTSGLFAEPQTILLTSGELVINKSLTIQGPGASQVTVSGNHASRVFFISMNNTVTLDGLTVSGGNGAGAFASGIGGGIYNNTSPQTFSWVPGSHHTIMATANAGYSFTRFSGALTGTTNPQSLTLSAPATVNATFAGSTGFNFVGFFQPVDNLTTVNSVNAGQSIPVKFSLTDYQGMNIFAAGFPASQLIPCSGGTPDPIEETAAAGSSSLSYDAATDRYTYVWKTEKAWKGTGRKLLVKFTDGTTQEALFQFR